MPAIKPNTPLCRTSPAAERNKGAILEALQRLLPATGRLLEIASGTGQHAAHCAAGLPGWTWQPSDPDPAAMSSITAWAMHHPTPGLRSPWQFDVLTEPWALPQGQGFDAVFCANMLHIAPWDCCSALMRGAASVLAPGGLLILYGPYRVEGEPTAAGNLSFDADLRARNPQWGLRWLHEVSAQARTAGLLIGQRLAMPANNQLLVFAHAGQHA